MRSIPAIAQELVLIEAVAGDDWWQDVSVPMLELMRIRLRGLVRLIDGTARSIVYTDFEDTAGAAEPIEIRDVAVGVDRARFREKAYAFLRAHEDDLVLHKIRHGNQLTELDLAELERIMLESGEFKPGKTTTEHVGEGTGNDRTVNRSASSGRFVTERRAKGDPGGTIAQRV